MTTRCRANSGFILRWLSIGLLLLSSLLVTLTSQAQAVTAADSAAAPASFDRLVRELPGGNLRQRADLLHQLADHPDPRLTDILNALVDGDLLADRNDPPTVAIRTGT